MSSLFTKIVRGEIPCHRIWEDEEHLAFLDIQPLSEGHTLVIPKRELDDLFDLSPRRAEALWSAAHKVAKILKQGVNCQRVAVLVLGYEVPHAHIHLIPTQSESEVLNPRRQQTDHPALARLASHIRGESHELEQDAKLPNTAEIEARWDEFATRFVQEVEETSLRVARVAIDQLQLESATEVLEIGCGGGGAGVEMFHRTRARGTVNLTLTDLSQEMINITKSRFKSLDHSDSVTIERADAQALPYPEGRFDRILSCLNLMIVPDPQAVINECARVLKSEGIAVFVVWGRPEYSHMMTLTGKALKEVGLELAPPARSNFHLGGRDTLREMLLASGFNQVRRWYQAMIADLLDGDAFAEMTCALRPELRELAKDEDTFNALYQALSSLAQEQLDEGEGIGLDALIVVARRA